MSSRQDVQVPYGKYRGNAFSMPRRFEKITNSTDSQNAIVVFGVLLLHYRQKGETKLMEVDEHVDTGFTSHWRLCHYGLAHSPSDEQLRLLKADMDPVKPVKIFFDPSRESRTLVSNVFLKGALVVEMPSVVSARSSMIRRPTVLEIVSSDNVEDYPVIVEADKTRAASLIRRKPVSAKRKESRRPESKLERVRQRFKTRSLFEKAYDALLGVNLETVVQKLALEEETEDGSPSDDELDQ